jgi:hypothetical protein
MQGEKAKSYHSYLLRCWQEQAATPDQPAVWRFVVQEVAGEQRRWAFGAFEQVMDFLLNTLLGSELSMKADE